MDLTRVTAATSARKNVPAFAFKNADSAILLQPEQGGGLAGQITQALHDRSRDGDDFQAVQPYVRQLHHAVSEHEPLRIAFRVNEVARRQRVQKAIERW